MFFLIYNYVGINETSIKVCEISSSFSYLATVYVGY